MKEVKVDLKEKDFELKDAGKKTMELKDAGKGKWLKK